MWTISNIAAGTLNQKTKLYDEGLCNHAIQKLSDNMEFFEVK